MSLIKPPDCGDVFVAQGGIYMEIHAQTFDEYAFAEAIAAKAFERAIKEIREDVACRHAIRISIDTGTIFLHRNPRGA